MSWLPSCGRVLPRHFSACSIIFVYCGWMSARKPILCDKSRIKHARNNTVFVTLISHYTAQRSRSIASSRASRRLRIKLTFLLQTLLSDIYYGMWLGPIEAREIHYGMWLGPTEARESAALEVILKHGGNAHGICFSEPKRWISPSTTCLVLFCWQELQLRSAVPMMYHE